MKRTLLLLVAFALTGALALWYLLTQNNDKTTLAGADRRFKVENPDEIYKIFIADRKEERITLERKGDYWLYNGKWKANPNVIKNLLDAITRIEIKYKPADAAIQSMVESLSTEGLKVEIYNKVNKKIKSYYVGGATADETGTYMIMEHARQPYVAEIPNWVGNLRFRYSLKGDEWRDKMVFASRIEDIQSVTIEYPQQKNKSFRLQRAGNVFRIMPFYDITPLIKRPYREGSAEAFLDGFKNIGAEAIINQNEKKDSITQLLPFSIITLQDKADSVYAIKLFPLFYATPVAGASSGSPNVERYYAQNQNGDFLMVQHYVFKKILWGYDFFFENP